MQSLGVILRRGRSRLLLPKPFRRDTAPSSNIRSARPPSCHVPVPETCNAPCPIATNTVACAHPPWFRLYVVRHPSLCSRQIGNHQSRAHLQRSRPGCSRGSPVLMSRVYERPASGAQQAPGHLRGQYFPKKKKKKKQRSRGFIAPRASEHAEWTPSMKRLRELNSRGGLLPAPSLVKPLECFSDDRWPESTTRASFLTSQQQSVCSRPVCMRSGRSLSALCAAQSLFPR